MRPEGALPLNGFMFPVNRSITIRALAKVASARCLLKATQVVVYGQAFTRLVTLMLPRPVAKSQPVFVGYA
jgi:hypothetical protein